MVNSRRKNKRAKIVEEVNHVEKEDYISQLPISIIPCILSFLPLKDAVRTTTFSKFWTGLWLSSTALDFEDIQVIKASMLRHVYSHNCRNKFDIMDELGKKYIRWVNTVLVSHRNHDEAWALKKFRIRFQLLLTQSFKKEITEWLCYALSRKVNILELDFTIKPNRNMLSFPPYHFPQDLHARMDVSCLRSLILSGVYVDEEIIDSILCNFRFLEYLKVCKSYFLIGFGVYGTSLSLTHLEITDCPNLKYIIVMDKCLKTLILERNPLLVHVCAFESSCTLKFEVLILDVDYHHDEVNDGVPEVSEMKELTLAVDPVREETLYRIFSILNLCPKLERFVLQFGSLLGRTKSRRSLRNEEYMYLTKSLVISLPCLKEVEVRDYYCNFFEDETLEFVFKLIETSPVERVIFNPYNVKSCHLPISCYGRVGSATKRVNLLKRVIPSSVELIVL